MATTVPQGDLILLHWAKGPSAPLQGTSADYAPCSRMMHRRSQLGKQGVAMSPTARASAAMSAIDTRPKPTLQTGPRLWSCMCDEPSSGNAKRPFQLIEVLFSGVPAKNDPARGHTSPGDGAHIHRLRHQYETARLAELHRNGHACSRARRKPHLLDRPLTHVTARV